MTNAEKREAARQLIQKWHNKGREDEDDRSYWLDILQRLLGCADATDRIEFQKKVIVNGNTKRIDAYIPETKIIIEQKSEGIPLDKKISQSGGTELTPYEQAKRYNDNLPTSEKAKWIITSNFQELWIYDMDTRVPENNVVKIHIDDLHHNSSLLDFLLEKKVIQVSKEVDLSQEAGKLVGKIYDAFLKQYHDPESKKALRMPVCLSKKIPLADTLLNTSQKTCVRLCCHCLRFWILPILTDPTYIFRKSWKHSPMSTAAYLPTRILSFQKSHRKSKTLLRKPGILIGGIFRLPFSALFLKAR